MGVFLELDVQRHTRTEAPEPTEANDVMVSEHVFPLDGRFRKLHTNDFPTSYRLQAPRNCAGPECHRVYT